MLTSTVPACQAYDPAFAYELGSIINDGMTRMYGPNGEDIFYYIALYNENYEMPAQPHYVSDADIVSGLYKWADAPEAQRQATIVFSGPAHTAAREAQIELAEHYGVGASLWSATSYKRLREDALEVERWNRLHPAEDQRISDVTRKLGSSQGPVIAVSDFMTAVPDQISRWVPRQFIPLGTDGYGRSDTREALRSYFEVNAGHVVATVLSSLASEGTIDTGAVADAFERYGIDPEVPNPYAFDISVQ